VSSPQDPTKSPISFDEFRQLVARELHVDESLVVENASFTETLYADSIRLVEMMLRLKDQGIAIPLEEAWDVVTVGDAYRLYCRKVGQGPTQA
jgi:acyl carrier protein